MFRKVTTSIGDCKTSSASREGSCSQSMVLKLLCSSCCSVLEGRRDCAAVWALARLKALVRCAILRESGSTIFSRNSSRCFATVSSASRCIWRTERLPYVQRSTLDLSSIAKSSFAHGLSRAICRRMGMSYLRSRLTICKEVGGIVGKTEIKNETEYKQHQWRP